MENSEEEKAGQAARWPTAEPRPSRSRSRSMDAQFTDLAVLLVDDDPQQAATNCEALLALGCNPVTRATSWAQATRVAAMSSPDLFVVDARLLGAEDGSVRRISSQHGAPVIFLVEQADTGSVRRAMKTQNTTSLVKPCGREALAVAIAQALKLKSAARV
jgi:two-component system, response regulator PdtaR